MFKKVIREYKEGKNLGKALFFSLVSLVILLSPSYVVSCTTSCYPGFTLPIGNTLSLSIMSPTNSTYNSTSVDLIWSADQGIIYSAYSLNAGAQIVVEGNTTISGLDQGHYELTLYVNDSGGGTANATIYFTIDDTPPRISHTPVETAIPGQVIGIHVWVSDDINVTDVFAFYRNPGQSAYNFVRLEFCESCNLYKGSLPKNATDASEVDYYIVASDGVNNASLPASDPESNPFVIIVKPYILPVTLNVSGVTESSITLNWTVYTGLNFKNYTIYKSSTEGSIGIPVATVADRSITSFSLTDLSSNTAYYFTVRVFVTTGDFADSSQVAAITEPTNIQMPYEYLAIAAVAIVAGLCIFYVLLKGRFPHAKKKEKSHKGRS